MLIQSVQLSPLQADYGFPLSFKDINPTEQKISDIISASRSNRISTLELSSVSKVLSSGESFSVQVPPNVLENVLNIDSSFLGTFKPISISYSSDRATIRYYQNLLDINTTSIVGDLYSVANIQTREFYIVQFFVESKVPETTTVNISPLSYVVGSSEGFAPVTTVQITSLFSKSSKVLIKMLVKDINNTQILKTEYIEIIVTNSSNRPCEIISENPIFQSYVFLNEQNNWEYNYQGYRIAEFIPNGSIPKDIVVKLNKKNSQILPSRGRTNKIRIIINPTEIIKYRITIDQIREAVLNKYSSIQDSFALANLANKSYDIVVSDILLLPNDLRDLVIAKFPPITGIDIKFNDVATSELYLSDIAKIPEVNLLVWNNNNNNIDLGEIHFDNTIYLGDALTIEYNNISLSGNLQNLVNGPNYLTRIN